MIANVIGWLLYVSVALPRAYFVAPNGDDRNPGTLGKPFATVQRAQLAVRKARGTVYLRGGAYYLPSTLVFTDQDSGDQAIPVVYRSYGSEKPVLSGGVPLVGLRWKPCGHGIYKTQIPADLETEELFVNGERQILARYPNFDRNAPYFDGFAADAISPERVEKWRHPAGGYFHAMHPALWGDCTWRILGKDASGGLRMEGGWQNNRGSAAHPKIRFVENIFEELDSPGEWYLDRKTHSLFYYPPAGLNLAKAEFVATRLRTLVAFQGNSKHPVKWISLKGIAFRQAARTVMDTREPLLRSDWAICRCGAILFGGAEDCLVEDCLVDQVGGNAIFVNDYNRRITIRGTHVSRSGASGVCFVGDSKAARSPLFNYDQSQEAANIDRTPGPRTDNYPSDCLVDDCLIHDTGRVEKQTAGVEIDLARRITVRHCSIYGTPRAGINIGDGCWGGNVVEFSDIFDTVRETGDHGSFNSWGRDRYWRPSIGEVDALVNQSATLPVLDAVQPNVLFNNRWRCDHGWDIDLDDGSSNYIIKNNLCLHGGIKNREGYGRLVENNVIVDNGFHPHVWYAASGDVFLHNIIWTSYQPASMHVPPWGSAMDDNLLQKSGVGSSEPAHALQLQSGRDEHSITGDARFVDPPNGDYRVKAGSPALGIGFVNFPMDRFGVQKPALRAVARRPILPGSEVSPEKASRDTRPMQWLGARVRNIANEDEMSAFGLPGVTGVLVLEVRNGSPLFKAGLAKDDVILEVNSGPTTDVASLIRNAPNRPSQAALRIKVVRHQKELELHLLPN